MQNPLVLLVLNGVIIFSMVAGLFFFFATSVGVLRFPDFFTRLHAAGKGDTLSTILILFSCSLFAIKSASYLDKTTLLTSIKILLIINFIFIGSPTATHALIGRVIILKLIHGRMMNDFINRNFIINSSCYFSIRVIVD